MVAYRRNRVRGGTYFFTLTPADRSSHVLVEHIDALHRSLWKAKAGLPFEIVAMVVLPDHLHAIWRLPEGDDAYSRRIQAFKFGFTTALIARGLDIPHRNDGRALWARRFWEHTIRDDRGLRAHIDYVHHNPVKHRWAERAAAWPYSTFHREVAAGRLPFDWGAADHREDSLGIDRIID